METGEFRIYYDYDLVQRYKMAKLVQVEGFTDKRVKVKIISYWNVVTGTIGRVVNNGKSISVNKSKLLKVDEVDKVQVDALLKTIEIK